MPMGTKILTRYLDTNGDGTGTKDAVGDYSSAAETFFITPPAGKKYTISRMLIGVQDSGSFDAVKYGNGVTLTNGIGVATTDATVGVTVDLLDGTLIKSNAAWGFLCYDADVKSWGAGDEFLLVRWSFDKSGVLLTLTENDALVVELNDDFTGLNAHMFLVQGYEQDL